MFPEFAFLMGTKFFTVRPFHSTYERSSIQRGALQNCCLCGLIPNVFVDPHSSKHDRLSERTQGIYSPTKKPRAMLTNLPSKSFHWITSLTRRQQFKISSRLQSHHRGWPICCFLISADMSMDTDPWPCAIWNLRHTLGVCLEHSCSRGVKVNSTNFT